MDSIEVKFPAGTTTPDRRDDLVSQIKALHWPNTDAQSEVAGRGQPEASLSSGAIRFATKLRAALGEERIIGFAGTTRRVDVMEVSQQTALALARMEVGPVLLIDSDIGRPRAHEMFGVAATPGLAEVIENEVPILQAISQTSEPRLFVMPAGRTSSGSARLFSSLSFRSCLENVRQQFRFVIVQIPSMDQFVEASLIATSTEGLVLVTRSGDTKSRLNAIRSELNSLHVKIVGALLSR